MNTRKIAEEYRLSHWVQRMQDRKDRGMNITEYCKSEGFHPNIYYYWQRKLREAACKGLSLPTPNGETGKKNKDVPVPKGWAICETGEEAKAKRYLPIEINGCRIIVENDTDIDLVKKVCKALVTL